jgi:tetratricopeptide (TPR) repeat protein
MNSSDRKQAFKAFEVVKHSTLKICNSAGDIIGTGFFVSSEGHFVTCAHVVADAEGIGKLIANGHVGITECYIGDANKDDIALLQVIDHKSPIFLHLVDLPEEQTFRCFGFSNEIYKDGAPIEGKIVGLATSTDSTLLNQRVLRLVTEGDSQAIKGGQSGAAVCVYNANKKQWQAVGILVASEGENGGIALPITNTVRQLIPTDPNILRWKIAKMMTSIAAISLISCTVLWSSLRKCPDERILGFTTSIDTLLKTDLSKASELADKFEKECSYNPEPLISQGFVIREKANQTRPRNQMLLEAAKHKFLDALNQSANQIARYGLGITLIEMGDYQKAIDYLQKIKNDDTVDENLKIKVGFEIGYSYWKLKSYKESQFYLDNVAQIIQKQGFQWNEINSKTERFTYYQQSLNILIDISENLWYENQENKIKRKQYYDNYKKYTEIFLGETLFPDKRKLYLDNLVNSIDRSKKNDNILDDLRLTDEYQNMLCSFYKTYNYDRPAKLQKYCKI